MPFMWSCGLLAGNCDTYTVYAHVGVANGTSKNVGLRKFCQDLEISKAFLISLEVPFFLYSLIFTFLSLETFYQGVSGSDFLTRISV